MARNLLIMEELFTSPLEKIALAVRNKEISSTDLVKGFLDRIEQVNDRINAMVCSNADQALKLAAKADLDLQPDDKLHIEGGEQRVNVEGEVIFPGSYPYVKGLRLRGLIERAGGFTSRASLAQASVIRQVELSGRTERTSRLQSLGAALTEDQRNYLNMRVQQTQGRLPVDFRRLFNAGDETQNVGLIENDLVRVPRQVNSVLVNGFVMVPGAIPFVPDYNVGDYISRAGGFNGQAKKRSVYVIKASTGNWIKVFSGVQIDPGGEIHVPGKKPIQRWRLFRETLTVLTQVATLVIAVRSIR